MSANLHRRNRRTYLLAYAAFFASFALLSGLGGWQLQRGLQKLAIEKIITTQPNPRATSNPDSQSNSRDSIPLNWDALAWRSLQLRGQWRSGRTLLLANRTYNGRLGFEVFTPLVLGDGGTLLINRGWVATPADAPRGLPDHPTRVTVRGQIYLPQKGFVLGEITHAPNAPFPKIIQYLDLAQLAQILGTELQPAVLVLEPTHPAAHTRIWQGVSMSSTRHFGYATQWWGLALVLLIFGVIWRRRA